MTVLSACWWKEDQWGAPQDEDEEVCTTVQLHRKIYAGHQMRSALLVQEGIRTRIRDIAAMKGTHHSVSIQGASSGQVFVRPHDK